MMALADIATTIEPKTILQEVLFFVPQLTAVIGGLVGALTIPLIIPRIIRSMNENLIKPSYVKKLAITYNSEEKERDNAGSRLSNFANMFKKNLLTYKKHLLKNKRGIISSGLVVAGIFALRMPNIISDSISSVVFRKTQ